MSFERRQLLAMTMMGGAAVAARPRAGAPPSSSSGVFDVERFAPPRDGKAPATVGLQKAIDTCAAAGGGTVLVSRGTYLTGPLHLRSHVNLHLEAGAVLRASDKPADYGSVRGRDEGVERDVYASVLTGVDLVNVSITGDGLIDGQGEAWWRADDVVRKARIEAKLAREAENPAGLVLRWPRPRAINLIRCRDVLIDGITIKDSPSISVQIVYCEDVVVDHLSTYQQRVARGTDGVLIDSSKRVRVIDSSLSAGSDCIALKAGYNEDGRRVNRPTEDVLISGCHLFHSMGSGVALGSETAGSIRNVLVSNCVIEDCLSGMHIRSPRGRGGVVERLRVSNVVMDGIREMALKVSQFYDTINMEGYFATRAGPGRSNPEIARSRKAPINEGTPTFRDFSFVGLTIGQAREVALIEGLPERFIRGLVLQDIAAPRVAGGIACALVAEVCISNVMLGGLEGPAVDAREVERLELHRLRCPQPHPGVPAVWLEAVSGAFVHGCDVGDPGGGAPWLHEQQTERLVLAGNRTPRSTATAIR
jgi:polygalacturonase